RVLLVNVLHQVGLRIAVEQAREIERNGLAETNRRLAAQAASRLRHRPREQHRLHDEHRRQQADDAERDPEGETAVPAHRGSGFGVRGSGFWFFGSLVLVLWFFGSGSRFWVSVLC